MIHSIANQFTETATIRLRNCSRILRHLRSGAEFNCRELSHCTELSIPTVSTIVSGLATYQLLENVDRREVLSGRPGKTFRIAGETSCILCVIIGTGTCSLVLISPDGTVAEETLKVFDTPKRFARLISEIAKSAQKFQTDSSSQLLGIGMVVPGLLDPQRETMKLSANLPFLNGRKLRTPIAEATGLPVVLIPSMESHFLAESAFGLAVSDEDFTIINFAGGIGVAVCMDGEFLRGRLGTGIELGHIPFQPNGHPCGCGNQGCLEQYGSDETVLRAGREALGRETSILEIVSLCQSGELDLADTLDAATDALAIAVASAINLFSPRKVLLFGHFLFASDRLVPQLHAAVERITLRSRLADCEILPPQADAHRSQQLGASVAVVDALATSAAAGKS